jgi:hypothetical protein
MSNPNPLLTPHSVLQRRRKEESIKGESKKEGENTLPWEDVVYYTDEKGNICIYIYIHIYNIYIYIYMGGCGILHR